MKSVASLRPVNAFDSSCSQTANGCACQQKLLAQNFCCVERAKSCLLIRLVGDSPSLVALCLCRGVVLLERKKPAQHVPGELGVFTRET